MVLQNLEYFQAYRMFNNYLAVSLLWRQWFSVTWRKRVSILVCSREYFLHRHHLKIFLAGIGRQRHLQGPPTLDNRSNLLVRSVHF